MTHGAGHDADPSWCAVPTLTVLGFLRDVRSGVQPTTADQYLAEQVLAHQGMPGSVRHTVSRTPASYAEHVADMLRAHGPWQFRVLSLVQASDLVTVSWRQDGIVNVPGPDAGSGVVEHGRAAYLVEAGRITQYWIDVQQHVGPCRPERTRCRTLADEVRRHAGAGRPASTRPR